MSSDLYAWLLEGTLVSSVAMFMVLALRRPLRAVFGASVAYGAWWLVPAALLAAGVPAAVAPAAVPAMAEFAASVAALPSAAAAPGLDVEAWLVRVWALGLAAAGLVLVRQQRRFLQGLGSVRPRGDGLFQSDAVVGLPAVIGWRSRIVLPRDFEQRYDPREQQLVLCHEHVHRLRGDLPASALVAALRCVFWFNPLVHVAAGRFRHDQELACDAAVLRRFPQSRRAYADALLKTQLADSPLPVGCHWFGSHPLKERIAMLKRPLPNKPRWFAGLALVAALTVAGGWGAWAAQPARTVASDAAGAGPSAVDVLALTMTVSFDGQGELVETLDMPAGEPKTFNYDQDGKAWSIVLTLTPQQDGTVFAAAEISRDGVSQGQPRLVFTPDQGAAIRIGEEHPERGFSGIAIELLVVTPEAARHSAAAKRVSASAADPSQPWKMSLARYSGEAKAGDEAGC